jgi:23S rRNA pseudouridine1911/1915/1917 synthase
MAGVGSALAPGLVHRLDTGTSGLLLAARSAAIYADLRAALRSRTVEKRYLALVVGRMSAGTRVRLALAHDPSDRRRMVPARATGRAWPAETAVDVVQSGTARSLVAVTIRTGVTHQVRVHLAHIGHPVLGDTLYGGPPTDLPAGRHALHASDLSFVHPGRRQPMHLASELPPELQALLL